MELVLALQYWFYQEGKVYRCELDTTGHEHFLCLKELLNIEWMAVLSLDLTHIVHEVALFAWRYLTEIKSKSKVRGAFWRASLVIQVLVYFKLEILSCLILNQGIPEHQKVFLEVVRMQVLPMNVSQDVSECFLSATHLALTKIWLEELLQALPDLFRL